MTTKKHHNLQESLLKQKYQIRDVVQSCEAANGCTYYERLPISNIFQTVQGLRIETGARTCKNCQKCQRVYEKFLKEYNYINLERHKKVLENLIFRLNVDIEIIANEITLLKQRRG